MLSSLSGVFLIYFLSVHDSLRPFSGQPWSRFSWWKRSILSSSLQDDEYALQRLQVGMVNDYNMEEA
jgi:hypothetical protein